MQLAEVDELVAADCLAKYLRAAATGGPIEDYPTLAGGVLVADLVDSLVAVGRFIRGGKPRP